MDGDILQKIWHDKYKIVPEQVNKTAEIKLAASGFNTNIDAVVKIKGENISELAKNFGLTLKEVENCPTVINSPKAAVCGIVKCFIKGIAEEWLTSDKSIDEWLEQNIGNGKMQMGGQAGIIANVLALTGAQKILVNTVAHPQKQAECFIASEKLSAADEKGKLAAAYQINRLQDIPPVHRIIEFDKDDVLILEEKKYVSPKANRFIATYDPLNAEMKINQTFANYLLGNDFDYFIFAGYNLLSGKKGLTAAQKSMEFLQKIKQKGGILHLEIASTQDKQIRHYVLEKIAALSDSLGLNERETLDSVEVLFPEIWENLKEKPLNAVNLLDAVVKIKEFTKVKRLQLHIFGLYLCLQDKNYKYTPEQSLNGMLCASVAAASKASLGYLQKPQDLFFAINSHETKICFPELKELAEYTHLPQLPDSGIGEYEGYDLIAIPTILVQKPKTLVGMGDTISALSLVCAR